VIFGYWRLFDIGAGTAVIDVALRQPVFRRRFPTGRGQSLCIRDCRAKPVAVSRNSLLFMRLLLCMDNAARRQAMFSHQRAS
jgi:hypothetical protein